MGTRNHQVLMKQTIRLLSSRNMEGLAGQSDEELDESDVWCCIPESKPDNGRKSTVPRLRSTTSTLKKAESGSMPVSIPDWSKILLHEYKSREGNNSYINEYERESDEGAVIIPPHEVVMRRRGASLSVVEGVGRTLKGRDLSRVRNAIWAQIEFQN